MFKKQLFCICTIAGAISFTNTIHARDAFLEAKAAYFYPANSTFRDIYSGGGIYGAELTCQAYKRLYAFASADYFHRKGSSLGESDPTTITFVPLGLGLKYLFPVHKRDFYLGAGVLGTYLHIQDDSPFVLRNSCKWGLGAVGKAGIVFNVSKHFIIDLFTNYTYTKIDFDNNDGGNVTRNTADISGWSFGAAIGYRFGCKDK